jgi:hypothetical protein
MRTYLCLCMHSHSCLVLASMHCIYAVDTCTDLITLNCSILARIWEYSKLSEAQSFWWSRCITVIMLCLCFPAHLITNTITLELKVYVNIHKIKVCCKLHMREQLRFPFLLQMFIQCEIATVWKDINYRRKMILKKIWLSGGWVRKTHIRYDCSIFGCVVWIALYKI